MSDFQDFNFKLAVINELMYVRGVLDAFDVAAYAEEKGFDAEQFEIIPEVREYFEGLEVPDELLVDITELAQDGGDEVYLQLCPMWDGEDDMFSIKLAEDVTQLPNLKRITLFYDEDPSILEAFKARGVEAEWL